MLIQMGKIVPFMNSMSSNHIFYLNRAKIPEQEYNLKNQPSDKNKTNDKKKKAKEITKSSGSRNFVIQLKKNNIKHDFKISKR